MRFPRYFCCYRCPCEIPCADSNTHISSIQVTIPSSHFLFSSPPLYTPCHACGYGLRTPSAFSLIKNAMFGLVKRKSVDCVAHSLVDINTSHPCNTLLPFPPCLSANTPSSSGAFNKLILLGRRRLMKRHR